MSLRRARAHGEDYEGDNMMARDLSVDDYNSAYAAQEDRMATQKVFEAQRDAALQAQYKNSSSSSSGGEESEKEKKKVPQLGIGSGDTDFRGP